MLKFWRRNRRLWLPRGAFVRRAKPKSAATRKRKKQVTGETLIVSHSENKRASSYGEEIQYFDLITVDLIIKILSKLSSAKSIAQCRCVSKLWSSIIRQPNYKQLFPIKSPPRFLFSFVGGGKLFFYTSSQPQNLDDNSSLVATRHHSKYVTARWLKTSRPVQGLVCLQLHRRENCIEVVISNPITGQSITLPKVTTDMFHSRNYLGYDPIDKEFKVLCIYKVLCGTEKNLSLEHQVVTLDNGSRNLLWRKIECCIPIYPLTDDEICINGVLYYRSGGKEPMIGCFDVRSERLGFISGRPSTLVNYKGKLGAVDNRDYKDFVLWVSEDSKKHKWSKYVYEKPLQWQRELKVIDIGVAGVTGRGEVVLYSKYATKLHFYIFHYNLEKNIVVRVRIEVPAFEASEWFSICTFPNYVEDVTLM